MPPKKAEGSAAPKFRLTHATYQDMIYDAIANLKDRNGSSRQSLKKYVKANTKLTVSDNMFDSLFNRALKGGVEKGIFAQPKGPSGGTKLAKKKAEPKKPAVKKEGAAKKAIIPEAAPKKATTAKKPAAAAKDVALTNTKTGRVAKITKPAAKKAAASKKAAPKKAAATKA